MIKSDILIMKLVSNHTQSDMHCNGVESYPAYIAGLLSIPCAAITPIKNKRQGMKYLTIKYDKINTELIHKIYHKFMFTADSG